MRIAQLRDELARIVDLDLVAAYRGGRRLALWRYLVSGRLRGLRGIYVESSSFLPSESDVAFLALARGMRIPILTYFRDAYQLFPEYYPLDSPRRWLSARLFRPAVRALAAVSNQVAVPSEGLGRVLFGDRELLLLPPGAPEPVAIPYLPSADDLLFVGDARMEAHGAGTLITALRALRDQGRRVGLKIVARPGQEPAGALPDWIEVVRASGNDIHDLLAGTIATVIPRPRGSYNDLALPIKLFDYLAYGRPVLVTPCLEQERVISRARAGVVIRDDAVGMAEDIGGFLALPLDVRIRMATAASAAARLASWSSRAAAIAAALRVVKAP